MLKLHRGFTRFLVVFGVVGCFYGTAHSAFAASAMTLSGTFSHRTSDMDLEMLGDVVCFEPTEETAQPISQLRSKEDSRMIWFCFSNADQAKADLGIPQEKPENSCGYEGEASIRVSGYELAQPDTDEHDSALLEAVLEKGKIKDIACEE